MEGKRIEKRDVLLYFIYAPVENVKLLSARGSVAVGDTRRDVQVC
jgi:hypothetical protein